MKIVQRISGVVLKILDIAAIILMITMVIFLLIQLIARGVFRYGFFWTEETAKISLIMLAYVGAATTSVNGKHVNVTIFEDSLKGRLARNVVYTVQQLIAIVFLIMVVIFSVPALEIASKSVTTNTQINTAIIYAIIPISCVIMILGHLMKIVFTFIPAKPEDGMNTVGEIKEANK
ncbi:MAG: TRAP transporter small permease subunit [Clostridiaceae bacterium]|nr:TRAP transporter small permease subunit [Clostridiaceae bacterium]